VGGGVTLRPAQAADGDAVAALFIAAWNTALPWLKDMHTEEETHDWVKDHVMRDLEVRIAERDGVIAGFSALHQGTIEHLYVHPDHQDKGVGSLLLEEAKARVPEGLELWTFQRNERARRFYEGRGFRLIKLTDGAGNEEREPDVRYVWP
jgi:GNAT superfamily N-acetyltransferase